MLAFIVRTYFYFSQIMLYRTLNLQDAEMSDIPEIFAREKPTYFVYDERYAARESN